MTLRQVVAIVDLVLLFTALVIEISLLVDMYRHR